MGTWNCIHPSRRLERECQRNAELMWLTGRLAPDFKTTQDSSDNRESRMCRRLSYSRDLKLFSHGLKRRKWQRLQ
jgi:transposase